MYCAHVEVDNPGWCSWYPALPGTGDSGTANTAPADASDSDTADTALAGAGDGNNANAGKVDGIGGGAVAGIAVAAITVPAAIGGLVFFFVIKKNFGNAKDSDHSEDLGRPGGDVNHGEDLGSPKEAIQRD
jgi:hypothetical protein